MGAKGTYGTPTPGRSLRGVVRIASSPPIIDDNEITTISFSGIPQSFRTLKVEAFCRSSAGTSRDLLWVRFNNETSTYRHQYMHAFQASGLNAPDQAGADSSTTYLPLGAISAWASIAPDTFGVVQMTIPWYSSPVRRKNVLVVSGHPSGVAVGGGLWYGYDPIHTLTFGCVTGTYFEPGSTITLYGVD